MREQLQNGACRLVRSPELWMLLVILLASLVARVAIIRIDRVVRWDEPDYLILGRNLFTGGGYAVADRPEVHYAPLFPLVTGLLYRLTGNMKLNSDIAYVLFGTLTLLPFYWLSKRLFGLRVGVMAAAFLCLYPPLTAAVPFWGTMLEPLYLFLLFSAFATGWLAWESRRGLAYLGSGALLGLAYLTKPEAIVYLGLMLALLILANLGRRSLLERRALLGLLALVLAFALVISPYIVFLYRHTGRIMISGKLGLTYIAGLGAVDHDPGLYDRALSKLDGASEEIIWFSEDRFNYNLWDAIRADPGTLLRRTWQNINTLEAVLFSRQVFPMYFLLLVGLAWFGTAWDKNRASKELFLISLVLPVLIFLPFHIELRYFAPMLPILLLWLAKGIAALADWLRGTWDRLGLTSSWGSALPSVLCVLLSGLILTYFLVLLPRVRNEGLAGMSRSRREAGLWLNSHSPADSLVMSRDPEVPFYAERRWAATPHEDYARFIAYVLKRGADYLVVDEREITVIRPQLQLLLNEDSPPGELRHTYTARDPNGRTIVYEVVH